MVLSCDTLRVRKVLIFISVYYVVSCDRLNIITKKKQHIVESNNLTST